MRKAAWVLVIVTAGAFLAKKTNVWSYAGTLWSQVKTETKRQIPTRFEIQRVRHELAQLDGDIARMATPIASYTVAVAQLQKDIAKTQATLAEQKPLLLTMAKDLETSGEVVVYQGEEFSVERVRAKLQRDFESYRRLESHLATQRKLLEAKEVSLRAAQEQLAKIIAKKREFELRLAQLEAEEETLEIARVGSKLELDDSRATQIEAALAEIERRQEVQRAEIELRTQNFVGDTIPVGPRERSRGFDPVAVKKHLEGAAP